MSQSNVITGSDSTPVLSCAQDRPGGPQGRFGQRSRRFLGEAFAPRFFGFYYRRDRACCRREVHFVRGVPASRLSDLFSSLASKKRCQFAAPRKIVA